MGNTATATYTLAVPVLRPEIITRDPILFYTFDNGVAANADGTLAGAVQNCTHELVQIPGEAHSVTALTFGPAGTSSHVTVPQLSAVMEANWFTVEFRIRPTAFGEDRMNLFEGPHPAVSCYLQRRDDGFALTGAICTTSGWQSISTETAAIHLNQWSVITIMMTGDDLVLLVDRQVVARQVFQNLTLHPVGEGSMFLGSGTDGQHYQFLGQMALLKIWDAIPIGYEAALSHAEETGVGEIESKYLDLGGDSGFLRNPVGPEQTVGKGRMRAYQGGNIYWSRETGAHEVHGSILTFYTNAGGPTGYLGFAATDEVNAARPGARTNRFEYGAIYWSPSTGAHEVHGMIFAHYLQLGAEGSFLGLPLSNEQAAAAGRANEFQGGTILWSPDSGAREVQGSILQHYRSLGGPGGFLGFPLTDESNVVNAAGQPTGGKLSRFQGGTIYWSLATGPFEVHGAIRQLYEQRLAGPIGVLGYPISNETGVVGTDIRYNDFQKGVIVWSPAAGARAVTELVLHLGAVRCGEIDDGWFDSSAELITYTTVWVDGQMRENNVRRPSGHGGDSFDINTDYHIAPVHSGTQIRFRIKVDDWDQASANDYLATIDKTFDVKSFWGMDNGSNGVYIDQPAIDKGGDAPRLDTVKFSFRLAPPSIVVPGVPFRQQAWWNFGNFCTAQLDRITYANTFSDVEVTGNWFEEFLNPFDSLYYELAYKSIAAGGNCFGMSLEGAYALADRSIFAEPIFQYPRTAGSDHEINIKHGYQIGAESIRWIISQLTNLNMVRPTQVFAAVSRLLDAGERPLVSMFSLSDFSGHTVLAYGYKKASATGPRQILVADPNVPWSVASGNPSIIECYDNDTFRFITNVSVPYASQPILGGMLPGTLMYHTPFHVVSGQPRTPFWEIMEALALLLGGVLIICGDVETDQLTADGAEFYGPNRGIRPGAVPGMARIPLLDLAGQIPEFYAQAGAPADTIGLSLIGRRNGQFRTSFRTGQNAITLSSPIAQNARDHATITGCASSRPMVMLETSENIKTVRCNYAVINDSRGRDYRAYQVDLQAAHGGVARMGVARRGTTLVIENAGPARPIAVRIATREANRVVRSVLSLSAEQAAGVLQIEPEDAALPHGTLRVKRLETIGGVVRSTIVGHPVRETH
jgi:hypothetical protein